MTEDWRASIDIREPVTVVAVDLTEAVYSVCHPLLLAKLKAYGVTDDALELDHSHLLVRRQSVKVDFILSGEL